ncbi:MAG TPA: hypothetical protein VMR23_14415 [Candidatus Limnocylindria bacterium]|nr:hypothetical protein [Candidatus Limnocylindria bacterium]
MRAAIVVVMLVCALAAPAAASEWGGLVPGATTMDEVRARYGGPTRTDAQKTDGYDTASWTYEGAQAPTGMKRMVVDFGLVDAGQFRRDVVRTFRLEPNLGAFDRRTILAGWGPPTRSGREADGDVFIYAEGLIVHFEKDNFRPRLMMFTPPQPLDPPPAKP